MADRLTPATVVQLAFVLAFVFFTLYLLVKIVRLAVRWIRWSVRQSSVSATVNLLSFAVAAYLFPRPLAFIVAKGWTMILTIVNLLPGLFQQQFLNAQRSCVASNPDYCINTLATSLLASWSAFLSNILPRLDLVSFPLVDAVLMTAVWVALANILSWAVVAEHVVIASKAVGNFIANAYGSMSSSLRANVLFFLILAIGSYLSFSSVIAIPSLQEAESQDTPKAEDLKKVLTGVALAPDAFNERFPKIESDLVQNIRLTSTMAAATPVGANAGPNSVDGGKSTSVAENGAPQATSDSASLWIKLAADNSARKLVELKNNWSALRESFRANQFTLIDVAVETFSLSDRGRKGVRETQQHYLNIELWYRRWWAQRAEQLNQCQAMIEQFVSESNGMFEALAVAFQNTSTVDAAAFSGNLNKPFEELEAKAAADCAIQPESYDVPARQDFGGYLGIFGVAARWLLKTESLSLVLITGLLGFGLLGAASSTFIRNVTVRGDGEPLVPNLASVVIRGGSAAILVFLAVYGGLAVFAGPSASPNPYVVLFTCLAAAVFSDDAWRWGQQQFHSRLSGDDADKSQQERGSQAAMER
jgi:hypothetical protein